MRRILTACFLLFGCAAPRQGNPAAEYVPSGDIRLAALIQSGLELAGRNRLSEAEIKFRYALFYSPGLDNVKINLAEVLSRQGSAEEAAMLFEDARNSPKHKLAAELGLAKLLANQGRNKEAIRAYEKALDSALAKRDFASAEASLSGEAETYINAGDYSMALCRAAEAYKLRRGSKEAAYYGSLLNSEHRYRRVLDFLGNESEFGRPLDAELYFVRGEAKYALHDFSGAISDTVKGLDLNPTGALKARLKLLSRAASASLGVQDVNEEDEDKDLLASFRLDAGGFNLSAPPDLLRQTSQILDELS